MMKFKTFSIIINGNETKSINVYCKITFTIKLLNIKNKSFMHFVSFLLLTPNFVIM